MSPGPHKPLCEVAFLLRNFPSITQFPEFSEPLARKVGLSFPWALPHASHACAQVQGKALGENRQKILMGVHPPLLGFRLERKLPFPQSFRCLWLLL